MTKRSNNMFKRKFKGATAALLLSGALLPASIGVAYAADFVAQLPGDADANSSYAYTFANDAITEAVQAAVEEQAASEAAQSDSSVASDKAAETSESASEAKSSSKTSTSKKKASKKLTTAQKAVKLAKKQIGVSYVWAGCSPSGFDCSGLIKYVYGKLGVNLSHNAQAQFSEGKYVSKDDLKPGDLVFFGSSTSSISHVGMYIGNGKYIHSPQPGETVCIASLADRSNYVGACRVA